MSYNNFRRPNRGRHSKPAYRHNNRFGGRPNSNRRGPKKDYIDPKMFVKAAAGKAEEVYVAKNTFNDFAVHPKLASNLAQRAFKTPTPIQDKTIPLALEGKDVIGIANTGTGKTMAFALPVINQLLKNPKSRSIILAPTRELAEQILEECKTLTRGTNVYWALLIGGSSMGRQIRDLKRRPNLVVGTPGRIKDHLTRGNINLEGFDQVVLDEVDRMLDMGFITDMREILSQVKGQRQSYFFSATMDKRVRSIVDNFSSAAEMVSVKTGETSDNVDQNVVRFSSSSEKIEKLHDRLIQDKQNKVLIFDDTRRDVERLHKELQTRGLKSDIIHGGKSQGQRKRALSGFKDDNTNVLIATDVAARGIDVDGITHVINYSTPQTYSDYAHRIGRTGRAGQKGYALTFVKA